MTEASVTSLWTHAQHDSSSCGCDFGY